jgi:glycogen(starch) synthase
MTRLLMTADAVGGVWTYALDLAAALRDLGVEVHLATMGPRPDAGQRSQAAACGAELWESDFALEWAPDPWTEVAAAGEWLLEMAARLRPDAIHLNGYVHAALDWPAPTVVVAHSCVLSWWQAVRGEPAPAEWGRYAGAVTAGLEAAGAVVAPSRAMADELRRWYGLERVTVIPNGRDDSWVGGSDLSTSLVLGAGRVWDEAKNLAALERVAPVLSWPVAIAGPRPEPAAGPRPEPAVEPAADRGARYLGRLPFHVLSQWLMRAGIFVAPARYEPFGLGILEAAQAGTALVLGRIPSLVELWDGAAVFVDPDDDDALARAVEGLVGDGRRRMEMAAAARQRARGFDLPESAHRYLALYRNLRALETA